MTKHTPGPWTIKPMGDKLYIESLAENPLTPFVCDTQYESCQSDEERETCQANATLIAATSEMVETLEYLENILSEQSEKTFELELTRIRYTLNKAKGN